MKLHAILLPGQLRCIDNNLFNFLDSAADHAHLFIVTDKEYERDAESLRLRYNATVAYVDDIIASAGAEPAHDHRIVHPEFIKLELALRQVLDWEDENKQKFRFIHRFRTDVVYKADFSHYISPLTSASENSNRLLLRWSVNYSGYRDAMIKLMGFPAFAVQYKTSSEFAQNALKSINIEPLRDSIYTRPFTTSLPVAILTRDELSEEFHNNVQLEYPMFADAVESFVKRLRLEGVPSIIKECINSNTMNCMNQAAVRAYDCQWFAYFPEHIFFLYINRVGLSAGAYASDGSENMPLKLERHATTETMRWVFRQIQAGDYRCLGDNINWPIEINSYTTSGGVKTNALLVFSCVEVATLSDAECETLCRIIDLLDDPSWLASYKPDFVKSMLSRRLSPPQSISADPPSLPDNI